MKIDCSLYCDIISQLKFMNFYKIPCDAKNAALFVKTKGSFCVFADQSQILTPMNGNDKHR